MMAERNISLPTVVASYLAFIQLILSGTEAGIPWRPVRDNKQYLRARRHFWKTIFVHRAHQHQSNEFSAMEVRFSDLTAQAVVRFGACQVQLKP